MRCARLHGIEDLRVETLEDPVPAAGELLIEVEACGICPTDLRKFLIGTTDGYPLNPGHEWLGHVVGIGDDVTGWRIGDRVYGDTYAGYADLALLPVAGNPWSRGPFRVPESLPAIRATFLEPLADCLHAIKDQGRVESGDNVVVIGAGQMGLQLVACAHEAGGTVTCVDRDVTRLALAADFGATSTAINLDDICDADCVILSIGSAELIPRCIEICATGARIVLFAGFGTRPLIELDMNALHYREITIIGSEWIGTPPHVHPERYDDALRMLVDGLELESLIAREVGLQDITDVYRAMRDRQIMKAVLRP